MKTFSCWKFQKKSSLPCVCINVDHPSINLTSKALLRQLKSSRIFSIQVETGAGKCGLSIYIVIGVYAFMQINVIDPHSKSIKGRNPLSDQFSFLKCHLNYLSGHMLCNSPFCIFLCALSSLTMFLELLIWSGTEED